MPADLFLPPPGLTDREERQLVKVQPTVALAGTSCYELAKRQQRGEHNSRPNLPLMLEAARPAERQKQAAVSGLPARPRSTPDRLLLPPR